MVASANRSRSGGREAPEPLEALRRNTPAAPAPGPREVVLDPARCADAGYLCSGLAERDEPRILRWSRETPVIRIGLTPPDGVDPARGRALQAAAAAGILAWQGKPFRIEIERRPGAAGVDFRVRWTSQLDGAQLGRADTRWFREPDGRTGMQVQDFVLVHRDPFAPNRPLATGKVELAAAHEMGHALGLPHSDSDRDVMFPTNTARSLSVRDYATMAALYSLENGALVPRALTPP
jgi:hypothetical protein